MGLTWWRRMTLWLASIAANPRFLIYQLSLSPRYWRAVALRDHVVFFLLQRWWGARMSSLALLDSLTTFRAILTLGSWTILAAIGALVAFRTVESLITNSLPSVTTALPAFTALEQALNGAAGNSFPSMLGTIAQVTATLIGLYFAAVVVVASTTYSNVSQNIRGFIAREKIGNRYIQFVAFVAALCLLQLGASIFGFTAGVLNAIIIVLLATIAVVGFLPLGIRLFQFYDPAALLENYVFPDLSRTIGQMMNSGPFKNSGALQSHYSQMAARLLDTAGEILAQMKSDRRHASLLRAGQLALGMMRQYHQAKSSIPHDSMWFQRTPRHPRWFEIGESQASIAIMTGTGPQHTLEVDRNWFEQRCIGLVRECAGVFVDEKDHEKLYSLCASLARRVADASGELRFDEALRLHRCLGDVFVRTIPAMSDANLQSVAPSENYLLALADIYGSSYIGLVIEFAKALEKLTVAEIDAFSSDLRNGTMGPQPLVVNLHEVGSEAKDLQRGFRMEREIAGSVQSPQWYASQRISLSVRRELKETLSTLVTEYDTTFLAPLKQKFDKPAHLMPAQLLARALEAEKKVRTCVQWAKSAEERLRSLDRISDLPTPKIEWQELTERIDKAEDAVLVALGVQGLALTEFASRYDIPDFFGHAYFVLAEECVDSLLESNHVRFAKLFPIYVTLAWSVLNKFRADWLDPSVPRRAAFYCDIIIDVMNVSGAAAVLAEISEPDSWVFVQTLWDHNIAAQSDTKAWLKALVASSDYRESMFAITPRSTIQTDWEQRVARKLRDHGVHLEMDYYSHRHGKKISKSQLPPLLQALSYGGWFHHFHHVFLAIYVSKRPEMHGENLGRKVEMLCRSIDDASDGDNTED